MSDNELEWWQCFSFCRPLEPTRQDWMEARLIGCFAGVSPREAREDWFDPMRDEDLKKERDARTVKELEERNRILKEEWEQRKLKK